ncbi:hypothetical protein [Streptomyces sp. NPDC058964]|uniref:hypothetical protein n=1 Tax=Streptomyces sp. NPDC058964 TaxID=3346681 RepID=UPI00369773FA
MRAIRVAAAAPPGSGILVLSRSAPAAVAEGGDGAAPFGLRVEPGTVAAGDRVTLSLNRDGRRGTATVSSGIFDTVRIPSGRSSATATAARDVRAGSAHRVTFSCDGASGSTDLAVTDGRSDLNPRLLPPLSDVSAQRGVQAGEGGSLAGFDLKEVAPGAVLVTTSVATAYGLAHRRCGQDGG